MLLLVEFFTFNKWGKGKGDPTSSYAITDIALRILRTHKPLRPPQIRQGSISEGTMKHNCLKIKINSWRVRLKVKNACKAVSRYFDNIATTLRNSQRGMSCFITRVTRQIALARFFRLSTKKSKTEWACTWLNTYESHNSAEPSWHRAARCSNLSARVVRRIFL